jgi:hypothetical protein
MIDVNGIDVSATMISGTPSIDGNSVIVIVQAGTNGSDYTLRVRVKTTGLDIIQDNLIVLIRD